MSNSEQPRKGNDKPKVQESGSAFKEALQKSLARLGLEQMKKVALGSDVSTKLTDLSKKGADAFGKLKESAKTPAEKMAEKRDTADQICKRVIDSGILTSPQYKQLEKSLSSKMKAAEKRDKEVHPKDVFSVEANIKGKDGKVYKVVLLDGKENAKFKNGGIKLVSFRDAKQETVVQYNSWSGRVEVGKGNVNGNDYYLYMADKRGDSNEDTLENAMSKTNIAELVRLFGKAE